MLYRGGLITLNNYKICGWHKALFNMGIEHKTLSAEVKTITYVCM